MKLSVIVPAYNEEKLITKCLENIRAVLETSARSDLDTEIVVVDNNSTDRTAELARKDGAKVAFEPINQISRARNAGARVATGDWFLFLDADSFPSAGLIGEILDLMGEDRIVGCGSTVRMENLPLYGRILLGVWHALSVACRWAAGSFLLCRADVFRDLGGFSEELYATEEVDLSMRLKKWGRAHGRSFVILTAHPLETSSRKVDLYSWRDFLRLCGLILLRPRTALRDPKNLPMWYDGRR